MRPRPPWETGSDRKPCAWMRATANGLVPPANRALPGASGGRGTTERLAAAPPVPPFAWGSNRPTGIARRSRPRSPQAHSALAMLRLFPVDVSPLPRVHVRPDPPHGSLRVYDRPSSQDFLVYTPRFRAQFRAGHRFGRWYVRPLRSVGAHPESRSFATAKAAIEALAAGSWKLGGPSELSHRKLRVIWSIPHPSRH
jgi:hypothetical protein